MEKIKTIDEKKYDKEIKFIMLNERKLKRLMDKPKMFHDAFCYDKIKEIRKTTYNLEEIMKKVNFEVSNLKLEQIIGRSEIIRFKNKEELLSNNLRAINKKIFNRKNFADLNDCFSVKKLNKTII